MEWLQFDKDADAILEAMSRAKPLDASSQ